MSESIFTRKTEGGSIVTPPSCEVKMTDGGLQLRFKLPTGGKVSISEAPPEGKIEKRGHYHRGLLEVYTVHSGEIRILYRDQYGRFEQVILSHQYADACCFEVQKGVCHAISQGPCAVFTTQTIGTPVGNPERNGNDWYLADEGFQKKAEEYFSEK